MRTRTHRCDPHIDKIVEFLSLGKTYRFIADYLSINYGICVAESELCVFCRNRNLKSRITHGLHKDKVPHCENCKYYAEIHTNHIVDRNTNVRVCTACMEVIPQRTVTSPEFCPERGVIEDETKSLV